MPERTGICLQCSGPTVRTGSRGKVPQICSIECRRARCSEFARTRYRTDERKATAARQAAVEMVCRNCGVDIPYVAGQRRNERCDPCRLKWEESRQFAKERRRGWRRAGIVGMSLDRFDEMQREQRGQCAICRAVPSKWVVDHDHETGAVRALLCSNCNVGLGMFGEDAQRLIAAAAYLKQFDSVVRLAG